MSEALPRRGVLTRWDPLTIGVDIGGTKVLGRRGRLHRGGPGAAAAADAQRRVSRGRGQHRRDGALALGERHESRRSGSARPGSSTRPGRRVMFSPHLAWRDSPLRDPLRPGSAARSVVDNDANAAALAEGRFGAGRGHRLGAVRHPRHRHRRCAGDRRAGVPRRQRDGGGVRPHAGRAGRPPLLVRQPGLLGAVRLGQRAGPRGPRAGGAQLAGGLPAPRDRARRPRPAHRPAGHAGRAGRGPALHRAARGHREVARRRAGRDDRGVRPELHRRRRRRLRAGELLLAPTRLAFARTLTGRGHRTEPPILAAELGSTPGSSAPRRWRAPRPAAPAPVGSDAHADRAGCSCASDAGSRERVRRRRTPRSRRP